MPSKPLESPSQQPPSQQPPSQQPPSQQPPSQQKKSPTETKNKALPIVPFILFLVLFLAALLGLSLYLIKPKLKASHKTVPAELVVPPVTSEPVKVLETPVQAIETLIEPVEPPAAEPVATAESMMKLKKVWPELKLTGIAQADRQRLAILNGKMLPAGRKLGDVTIIQVRDGNIIVEYKGEHRTLYIGE